MKKALLLATMVACAAVGASWSQEKTVDRTVLLAKASACWTESEADSLIRLAERSDPSSLDLVTGIVRHNLAVQDPSRWAEKAISVLQKCAKNGDPVALAYCGSAITVRAGVLSKKGDLMGATAGLEEGCAMIDRALSAAPGLVILRFLRAENAASVSEASPFPRWDVVEKDVEAIEKSGVALSAPDRAQVEVLHARIAFGRGKTEEGLRRLEAAIRAAPGSRAASDAKRLLSEYEE